MATSAHCSIQAGEPFFQQSGSTHNGGLSISPYWIQSLSVSPGRRAALHYVAASQRFLSAELQSLIWLCKDRKGVGCSCTFRNLENSESCYHSVSENVTFLSHYHEACLPKGLGSCISLGVWNLRKKSSLTDLYRDNAVHYCYEIANLWLVRREQK